MSTFWHTWGPYYEWSYDISYQPGIGQIGHLRVRKKSGKDGITWDTLYAIKNAVVGSYEQAIEVYPPVDKLVDGANYRHLWVMPYDFKLPTL